MRERHRLTIEIAQRYRVADRKRKTAILDEFVATAGYNRKYAIHLLVHWGKSTYVQIDGESIRLKAGRRDHTPRRGTLRYGHELDAPLAKLWVLFNCSSPRHLKAAIGENLEILLRAERLGIPPPVLESVSSMSASTMDRRLASRRRADVLHGISHTRPARALKELVPIRSAFEWKDALPGDFQADTVAHEGGLAKGDYCFTLVLVDVASGWTELRALRNRAARWVTAALTDIWDKLPFPCRALHTDNGGEFINRPMVQLCADRKISFTRSRADKKNDNCYVECRNDDAVRRSVGYVRVETEAEYAALGEFYRYACLLANYFYPTMRLQSKTRDGGRLHKTYDQPRTPYRRLLDSVQVREETKDRLRERHDSLDLIELKLSYDIALDRFNSLIKAKLCPAGQRPASLAG